MPRFPRTGRARPFPGWRRSRFPCPETHQRLGNSFKEGAGSRALNMYRQGYTHEDIERLGVDFADIQRLDHADRNGASGVEFDALVTDAMIDAIFIAGTPGDCVERMLEVQDMARKQGFGQLLFSELGPDVDEAMALLCDDVIPAL